MMKMTELIGHELRWVQPRAMKMEFELRTGDIIAATLRFRSIFGTFATAASADGSWTFKDVGFWQNKLNVFVSGAETDLAVFTSNKGTLELPDGRKYLYNGSRWPSQYEFNTETGDALISYRKLGGKLQGMLHLSYGVEIHALAKEVPEMPWMVSLGLYVMIQWIRASSSSSSGSV